MLAHLAEALGDTQMAVRIGKTGIARGLNLIYYAYPVHSLPAYTPLRQPPETAVHPRHRPAGERVQHR